MNSIEIVVKQLKYNSKLFQNVLKDMNDDEGLVQISESINHISWIAGHLLMIRYRLALNFGLKTEPNPHVDKYNLKTQGPPPNNRPLEKNIEYPGIQEIIKDWKNYSDHLITALNTLDEKKYLSDSSFQSPLGGSTVLDMFAFIVVHESYHIGQMSIIRKSMGKEPMSFT